MKFGVIICPFCKKVKGVNLKYKTSTCISCSKSIKLDHIKILYVTNSQEKLRKAIGIVNADMNGNIDVFKKIIEKK